MAGECSPAVVNAAAESGGESSSLVLLRRSLRTALSRENVVEGRCPRMLGWRWRNGETGEVLAARCGANGCAWCMPINARQRAAAIPLGEPERFITLTQVGDDWQTRRARLNRFRYEVAKEVGRIEWCYHCEPNPKETGYHVHAYQRGDFLDQKALSRLADYCGMGRVVHIEKFEVPEGTPGIHYGLKLAGISYGLKLAESARMAATYLGANGGRLTHQSRGFFPGGLRAAVEAARGPSEGLWVLERGEVPSGAVLPAS